MTEYRFDGLALKSGGKTIANVKGNEIREGTGSRVVANIHGEEIRGGTGSHALFNIKGDEIRSGTGPSRVAKLSAVDADISGPGRVVKAALWLFFCR
jgi:hypothetical protein